MQNSIQKCVIFLRNQLKQSHELLKNKENFIQKLELQYNTIKGKYDECSIKHLGLKLEHEKAKYEVGKNYFYCIVSNIKISRSSTRKNKNFLCLIFCAKNLKGRK